MTKIILSQEGCSKCKTLASQVPDAEIEELSKNWPLQMMEEKTNET